MYKHTPEIDFQCI